MEEKILAKSGCRTYLYILGIYTTIIFALLSLVFFVLLVNDLGVFALGLIISIAGFVLGLVFIGWSDSEIIVTEKFINLKTQFNTITIPINKVTCISESERIFKSLKVTVASARLSCFKVENLEDVYRVLTNLIEGL